MTSSPFRFRFKNNGQVQPFKLQSKMLLQVNKGLNLLADFKERTKKPCRRIAKQPFYCNTWAIRGIESQPIDITPISQERSFQLPLGKTCFVI
ncbi:hypothetical protein X474_12855 [Dethiosulfatarculus sandiegensis]|uniref:Uncharacterized protein n=1 Tax=Dethiosulfatarculus sandiegensis TaxID=1429043 RepID=A0A0D2GGF9_9BACT|nr:hypothetical protein X474_12855 [Dethiosulfatarculus sandiegensis]